MTEIPFADIGFVLLSAILVVLLSYLMGGFMVRHRVVCAEAFALSACMGFVIGLAFSRVPVMRELASAILERLSIADNAFTAAGVMMTACGLLTLVMTTVAIDFTPAPASKEVGSGKDSEATTGSPMA